jgi:hypothetical protein
VEVEAVEGGAEVLRLARMVRQLRPDWKPSRQSFSNRRRSSTTG